MILLLYREILSPRLQDVVEDAIRVRHLGVQLNHNLAWGALEDAGRRSTFFLEHPRYVRHRATVSTSVGCDYSVAYPARLTTERTLFTVLFLLSVNASLRVVSWVPEGAFTLQQLPGGDPSLDKQLLPFGDLPAQSPKLQLAGHLDFEKK